MFKKFFKRRSTPSNIPQISETLTSEISLGEHKLIFDKDGKWHLDNENVTVNNNPNYEEIHKESLIKHQNELEQHQLSYQN